MTQVTAAKQLGITQPSLSQFLNCIVPLNTDMVLRFAELLEANPVEIDPELKNVDSLMAFRRVSLAEMELPYLGTITGKSIMGTATVKVENIDPDTNSALLDVDTAMYVGNGIPKGSTVILDLDADPRKEGRLVAMRLRGTDGFHLYQFQGTLHNGFRLKYMADDTVLKIRSATISAIHLVHSIQFD